MNYNDSIKKVLVGLIMLVAVAAGITIIASMFIKKAPEVTEQTNNSNQEITKTEVAADKDPEKFPAGIPIEEGAAVMQNYNATARDGRFQATKVFETKRTLAQNFTTYENYLKTNGWEIKSSVNEENYKMLFGENGKFSLQVTLDHNTVTDIKTVNISYTEANGSN